ncbi:hypothetical protein INT43_001367 [Umbelopsis isabellina]|uniref:Uncharacterized protein n=1 Tax=Mortierella isabellina TaxID=91625 RepID=A0A8H7PL38_MORIS|nr:hypothetical protein INT43_001367 [Umbelopsis isabellina]
MFKLKSRKATQPLSATPPTIANIVDLSILTTHASIIESFSDDLLKQFDHKRSTIVAMPYYSEIVNEPQPAEENQTVDDQPSQEEKVVVPAAEEEEKEVATEVPPEVPPKDIYQAVLKPTKTEVKKSLDANMLELDDAFQRFINGGDTPDLTVESRTPSVASENVVINNVPGQTASTFAKDIDTQSERNSLLRKSSSYLRSKFKKFRVVKSTDSLRKANIADDDTPCQQPSPALETLKNNKFSLDAARSFKLSAFTQNFKNNPSRMTAQDALRPSILEEDAQSQQPIPVLTSPKIASTLSQNTTICIPQYSNRAPPSPGVSTSTSTSVPQAPIIAYYPPKPLRYSPVELKDDNELPSTYQRQKAYSASRRVSLPAVIMRSRSASHGVATERAQFDLQALEKAERRKSDSNMLPMTGTFGRGARMLQNFVSGNDRRLKTDSGIVEH